MVWLGVRPRGGGGGDGGPGHVLVSLSVFSTGSPVQVELNVPSEFVVTNRPVWHVGPEQAFGVLVPFWSTS